MSTTYRPIPGPASLPPGNGVARRPGVLSVVLPLLILIAPGLREARAQEGLSFERAFTGGTMRVDYFHSGTAGEEHVSLDRVRQEGPWPGRRAALLDTLARAKYMFRVFDLATQQPLYSGGFASIYGEWEITGEAAGGVWRTFHESVRFPYPAREIQFVILKRTPEGAYDPIFSTVIDPNSRFVNRDPLRSDLEVWNVVENGPPEEKVDVVILADGYTRGERTKFHRDVERLVEALFRPEPFRSRRDDFNVRAVDVVSADSGIDDPREGIFHRNALESSFNSFDSDRYVLSFANRAIREAAATAPYDCILIFCNTSKYGGGGIYNLYATTAVDNVWAEYLLTHEFGHSFAGLGDEYYTSSVAYLEEESRVERPEPNITTLSDPERLAWRGLVDEDTPLPTPWSKTEYESLMADYRERRSALLEADATPEELNALSLENAEQAGALLAGNRYAERVGAFEGAGYVAEGLYRPAVDCRMFRRGLAPYCPVCRRAIERRIDFLTR
jgi:hypothetical protein